MNFKSSLGILRITGVLEGLSWIALLTTMLLKYQFQIPEPNVIVGKLHGVLFIAFVIFVIVVAMEKKWDSKRIGWCLLASFFPFGTFIADYKIFQKNQ